MLRRPVLAASALLVVYLGLLPVSRLGPATARVGVLAPEAANSASPEMADAPAVPGGVSFVGTPAVGALFTTTAAGGLGSHFCTASVVDSPGHDLVMTAAHCVSATTPDRIAFVPEYHSGQTPYGIWGVERIIVNQAWTSSADPNDDFAFLVIDRSRSGKNVQDVTRGELLATGVPPGQLVRVIGYPEGEDSPISCENVALSFSPTQLEFSCGGYTDGTSGGPWLVDVSPSTGLGRLIGVVGGYEQGGYTPSVSYAATFGASVAALYKSAIAAS
ncbi:MAG TPA: trypsin-like serine protease [Acidimicrobiales bacterium]|nr:trypsin-like serine protease [Acidimicrobiales bacterium]